MKTQNQYGIETFFSLSPTAYIVWGILISLQPPFYPLEAEKKGAEPHQVKHLSELMERSLKKFHSSMVLCSAYSTWERSWVAQFSAVSEARWGPEFCTRLVVLHKEFVEFSLDCSPTLTTSMLLWDSPTFSGDLAVAVSLFQNDCV